MDTLAVIIIACLVTIVILVLIVRNSMLSNKITDTTVKYDRLKRENDSLEKENKELADENKELADALNKSK
jgi:cell division protein FtsL